MALFTLKMYPQPTTALVRTSPGGRLEALLERTRAVISILIDVGRLIDRTAAFAV